MLAGDGPGGAEGADHAHPASMAHKAPSTSLPASGPSKGKLAAKKICPTAPGGIQATSGRSRENLAGPRKQRGAAGSMAIAAASGASHGSNANKKRQRAEQVPANDGSKANKKRQCAEQVPAKDGVIRRVLQVPVPSAPCH